MSGLDDRPLAFQRDVRMLHVLGGPERICKARLAGNEILVLWGGGAGELPCKLSSGRFTGEAGKIWRMHDDDLAKFQRRRKKELREARKSRKLGATP